MTSPDSDSLSTYGGALNDYGVAVVDPTTDRAAAAANKAMATVAMNSRMSPRAEVVITGHATTPVLVSFEAVWKGSTATAPTMARVAQGRFTATFPASVNDELAQPHTLNLTRSWGNAEGTTAYLVQCRLTSPNVIELDVFDMAGAATDAVGVTLVCWAR